MRITTDGLIIGTQRFKDSDRLLTVLSGQHGVLRAYARGAGRFGSKLCGSTELLCYSRFVLFKHKDKYTVDAADVNCQFFNIRQDIGKLALASYLCEFSADTSPVEAQAQEYVRLLLNCLHMLETGKRENTFIKPLFELRQISLAGYMPDLVACTGCGAFKSPVFYLNLLSGTIECESCSEKKDSSFVALPSPIIAAMRHILYSEPEKLFSFTIPAECQSLLCKICEKYVQAQLSRTYKTLDFYHSIENSWTPLKHLKEKTDVK